MTTYEEWLTGRGLSPNTIRARTKFYRSRARDWARLDQPADVIASWLGRYTGWTRCTYHGHLSSIFEWMIEEGALAVNPMVRIRKPPTPRPRPKPLADRDLHRALDAADDRTRTFLLLGYLAGLRAGEIAKIHGRDLDESTIYVLGKGGKAERVPTHPVLWQLAQRYPRDGYWFPPTRPALLPHIRPAVVSAAVGRLFRTLGLSGATHRARHTFGTTLLRGGANIRVVQELMRHSSLATTALYLGVDEEERQAAIFGLVA